MLRRALRVSQRSQSATPLARTPSFPYQKTSLNFTPIPQQRNLFVLQAAQKTSSVDAKAPAQPKAEHHDHEVDHHEDDHHEEHHHEHHEKPNPEKGAKEMNNFWLFGQAPDQPREWASWEIPSYLSFALVFIALFYANATFPDNGEEARKLIAEYSAKQRAEAHN
eukprot:TRINITY_DN3954_c0_g1_i1.p1 TRINITY_DN3954_c0_g1~~TRINITY_DN3954_c0_g1_i1.p1  ORF type:complete len:182 (-),score=57.53 TRINITY_DN3954_c0_g1_i1:540-1034(-)